ncbi:hypothetical protein CR513_58501, partial [Mucuna pruriens]
SNPGILHAYDPEINSTFHRLIRSPRNSEVVNNSHNGSTFASDSVVLKSNNANFDFDPTIFDCDLGVCISKFILDNMVHNNRTLKELATLDIMCQPLLIHLMPKFHGLIGEDPHKHFKEFRGARNLIYDMTINTQQFGVRESAAFRVVNMVVVDNQRLENKIS